MPWQLTSSYSCVSVNMRVEKGIPRSAFVSTFYATRPNGNINWSTEKIKEKIFIFNNLHQNWLSKNFNSLFFNLVSIQFCSLAKVEDKRKITVTVQWSAVVTIDLFSLKPGNICLVKGDRAVMTIALLICFLVNVINILQVTGDSAGVTNIVDQWLVNNKYNSWITMCLCVPYSSIVFSFVQYRYP